jgi:UDPglucose 6-dehydrogenase
MSRVLIIGHGYVGSAVSSIFSTKEKIIIDPKINKNKISDFKTDKFDVIFVCVDTPKNQEFKTLYTVLSDLNKTFTNTIVCCKSTATPDFYYNAEKQFKNIKLIFSPEYLSHKTNIKDFNNQDFLILGGDKKAGNKVAAVLKPRLKKLKTVSFTDIKTAALVKYTENAFLAYKVTFFNEMYLIHKKISCSSTFNEYTYLVGLDKRIGSSHMQVPGPDGKFGWGGHCYDKDNYEFQRFSQSKLIKYMRHINCGHRK